MKSLDEIKAPPPPPSPCDKGSKQSKGRPGRKAHAVSNDTDAPRVRKTKKGAAFGKADLVEILSGVTSASRDVLVRRMAARVGGALSTEQVKAKLGQMLSPCNSRGLFERLDNGDYRLAKTLTPQSKARAATTAPRRGQGSRKRAASGSKPRRRVGRDAGVPVFVGSRREELGRILVERMEGQTKSAGQLANDIAPLFPLAGKREVCDAIGELLGEDDRFVMTSSGDWRLA